VVTQVEVVSLGTHYELLGVEPRSTRDEIERAYRFHRDMYGEGALATYSLLDPDEIAVHRAQLDEAFRILSRPDLRRAYDLSLGVTRPSGAVVPFPTPKGEPANDRAAKDREPETNSTDSFRQVATTGADLKRAREARGISLRDISMRTKVGARFLEYIEDERLDMLPATVYLRGFVAEFARAVGLDPRASAEAYIARLGKRD
jgi:flagellar biosynthesis protein FlhG